MVKEIESSHRKRGVAEVKLYDGPSKDRNTPGVLLLDFNERTTPPHKLVQEALAACAKEGRLQIYPDYKEATKIIAEYVGVNSNEVILTNGSDDGIGMVSRTLLEKGDKIVIPGPTFSTLEDEPLRLGAKIVDPRPRYQGENLDFPFEDTMRSIKPDIKMVVICNPNNPTGTGVPREQLEQIITKAADVGANVLVDEAYYEFSKLTTVDLVSKFDNLFITRTLSKAMGVAGVRVGYIVSQNANIDEIRKVQNPYAVNAFAVATVKTLQSSEVRGDMGNYASEVMEHSKPMVEDFYRKNNIKFFPSMGNFHLLRIEKGLVDFLKNKGIFIRVKESLPGMVRASIGTKQDTEKYLSAVGDYLKTTQT